jgi:CDP-4-dehydro-6-deoxyglucose reductase
MHKITIKPDNIVFNANVDENILNAGLKHKLNLSYSCQQGNCAACKTKIISGQIKLSDNYNKDILTVDDKLQGYTLLCQASALSDIELHIPNILSQYPPRIIPSKVLSFDKQHNVAVLRLQLATKFNFCAGQYIEILFQGKTRAYSIANCPNDNNIIEIHIKYYKGGAFSEHVWHNINIGDILRFRGPLGLFQLSTTTNNSIICVCTSTGIAPIKSILEQLIIVNSKRKVYLYWGNRDVADFYQTQQLTIWQQKLTLQVTLCTSNVVADGFFHGYVTSAIKQDFTDLTGFDMYACGNSKMLEDVFQLSHYTLNLHKDNFFSDAFVPSVN